MNFSPMRCWFSWRRPNLLDCLTEFVLQFDSPGSRPCWKGFIGTQPELGVVGAQCVRRIPDD